MKPKVSVIIPFYNNFEWLCEAIESVAAQTYSNIEIIVVNDGSKEAVDLSRFGSINVEYFYQKNGGAAAARNFAIEKASGDYVAFLDSDDKWERTKIEKQVDFLQKNPDYVWVHCSYQTFGKGKTTIIDSSKTKGMVFPNCLRTLRIATPCVVIRRTVLSDNKAFRFNNTMKYGEDYYLWISLAKEYKLGVISDVLCYVRMHGNNASKRAYALLKFRGDFIDKSTNLIDWLSVDKRIRKAYELCSKRAKIIENSPFLNKRPKLAELASKFLYLRPYLLLHK